ncbi:MAG: TolC family protein [Thiomonas sp.]
MPAFACRRAASKLLLAALLGGCASVPPPQSRVTPQRSARALERRSLSDPGLLRFMALQTGMPQTAGQPWTLQRLGLAALYFHSDLRVSRASVQLAKADLQIARQYPNPSLQLGLKYGSAAALMAPSPWTVGAAIGLLLQSQTRRAAQTAQAEAGVRAARLLLRDVRWRVLAQVQQAGIALWSARRRVRLQQRVLDTALALQGRTAARAQAGMDSPLAAALAQQSAQQAALEKSRDLAAQQAARVALAAAIGLPDSALQGVTMDFSALDRAPPDPGAACLARLRHEALERRDSVRAAWQGVQAAQAALQSAQSLRWGGAPSIAPGAQRDQGVNRLTLAAHLPLPLLNQHQGQIAAARTRLAQREAVLQQIQAQVLARIEQADTDLGAAQEQARQSEQSIAVNQALLDADVAAQAKGLIGPVQTLRMRLRLLSTQQAGQQARAAQWRAFSALLAALQQPISSLDERRSPHPSPHPASPPAATHLSRVVWKH